MSKLIKLVLAYALMAVLSVEAFARLANGGL